MILLQNLQFSLLIQNLDFNTHKIQLIQTVYTSSMANNTDLVLKYINSEHHSFFRADVIIVNVNVIMNKFYNEILKCLLLPPSEKLSLFTRF